MLVAESCPSFADVNNAWRAFTENDYALTGAQSPPTDLAIIRIAEHEAWLGPIHVGPTDMTVEIHGDAVNGAVLELNGATDRMDHRLDGPGTVTLPLTNGLPGGRMALAQARKAMARLQIHQSAITLDG
jgi:hypothetical protein